MGLVHYRTGEVGIAREYFLQAHTVLKELEQTQSMNTEDTQFLQFLFLKDTHLLKSDWELEQLGEINDEYRQFLVQWLAVYLDSYQGLAELMNKNMEKAEAVLQHAYQAQLGLEKIPYYQPGDRTFHINRALARLYVKAKQYDKAKPFLNKALSLSKTQPYKASFYPGLMKDLRTIEQAD